MINITFTPDTILMICTDSDDEFRLPGPVPSVPSPFVVSVVCVCFLISAVVWRLRVGVAARALCWHVAEVTGGF